MADAVALVPTEGVSLADIDAVLRSLGCRAGEPAGLVRTFYDTFDGRLFRAGLVLEHERVDDHRWLRVRRPGETVALAQAAEAQVSGPVDRLRDRRLKRLLAGPAAGRALLPLLHTEGRVIRYGPVDALDKTTVRVVVTTVEARDARGGGDATRHLLEPVITVAPVRGHERAHERMAEAIALRLGQRPAAEPLRRAAGATGVPLGWDPSDRSVPLVATAPARDAVTALLRRAAAVLEANGPGVIARTDDEFLHDFRVTLRSTRAVVDAAEGVLDPDDRAALQRSLADLMGLTSPVRDLDVLRAAWRHDEVLAVLLPALEQEYGPAHRALCEAVEGAPLAGLLALLRAERAAGPSSATTAAWAAAVLPGQLDKLHRRIRRVRRAPRPGQDGGATAPLGDGATAGVMGDGDGAADEALHAARKAAKRLRYLLDVVEPLDPDDRLRPLRRVLKQIQTDLGAFQDGVVTVAAIDRLAPGTAGLGPEALMELGARAEVQRQAARAAAARVVADDDELERSHRRFRRRLAALAEADGPDEPRASS